MNKSFFNETETDLRTSIILLLSCRGGSILRFPGCLYTKKKIKWLKTLCKWRTGIAKHLREKLTKHGLETFRKINRSTVATNTFRMISYNINNSSSIKCEFCTWGYDGKKYVWFLFSKNYQSLFSKTKVCQIPNTN